MHHSTDLKKGEYPILGQTSEGRHSHVRSYSESRRNDLSGSVRADMLSKEGLSVGPGCVTIDYISLYKLPPFVQAADSHGYVMA